VYALDHSAFIEIAKRIAIHNGVDSIEFVRTDSRAFQPPEQVDVILHEQIGDDLFDENMLVNLLDLKRRILKPSGRILPGRFEFYLEPVSVKPGHRVQRLEDSVVHGIDFGCLRGIEELGRYRRRDYDRAYLRWGAFGDFLCEPTPLLAFDLNTMTHPDELPHSFATSRIVARAGTFDGLCLYFRVIFDEQTSFETSPARPRTYWANRMFRAEGRDCVAGDMLSYELSFTDPVDVQTWTVSVSEPWRSRGTLTSGPASSALTDCTKVNRLSSLKR
jgi:protein arginine N-methyltransferase 1